MRRGLRTSLLTASAFLLLAWASSGQHGAAITRGTGEATSPQLAQGDTCAADWTKCRNNADLIEHYSGMTQVRGACRAAAEDKAQYGRPDWPWTTFGRYRSGDDYPKTGMITILETDARFQNGFGAIAKVVVGCLFDLRFDKVVDVEIEEGQ